MKDILFRVGIKKSINKMSIAQINDNFLTDKECDELISFFENNKNLQVTHRDTIYLRIMQFNQFKKLFDKINSFSLKINNAVIDWIEITKWSVNSFQPLHYDTGSDKTILSSVCYLNDNFLGGQTFFEDGTVFKPKKNRILFFNGMYYKHGVVSVQNGTRYTLATWYKNNDPIK